MTKKAGFCGFCMKRLDGDSLLPPPSILRLDILALDLSVLLRRGDFASRRENVDTSPILLEARFCR